MGHYRHYIRLMKSNSKSNIFLGLFYNLSPDKTIAQRQIEGLKKDKTIITLCLTSYADGTDKLELLIIGHFEKPRCFQRMSGKQLGFYYRSNKKAWMTRELFQEWLMRFHEKIKGSYSVFS